MPIPTMFWLVTTAASTLHLNSPAFGLLHRGRPPALTHRGSLLCTGGPVANYAGNLAPA